eukprot:6469671-Amphidinium_carterae.1
MPAAREFLSKERSEPVHATHGMPPACGHAVDLLHAFLLKTLKSAGKYVDDMLVAKGPNFAGNLCHGYRHVHKSVVELEPSVWDSALAKGRGSLADRSGCTPQPRGWKCFTWYEVDYKVKWDSARVLLAEVATKRFDFSGLETGLSTQSSRHLKKSTSKVDDKTCTAVNAAMGGVWHEVRTYSAFAVGELCVVVKKRRAFLTSSLGVPTGTRNDARWSYG